MTATEDYIRVLTRLKPGDLGLLRTHAGQGLDETLGGFDLFAGLWWPLRQKNQRAPRREVAWLTAKLYAFRPVPHASGQMLALQLGRCQPRESRARERYRQEFDRLLTLPLRQVEPALRWAVGWIGDQDLRIDWVKLTDDLSRWEHESVRLRWAEQFLETDEGGQSC